MKIKLLSENARIPERATEYSAGYDLCACLSSPIVIKVGEIKKIPTGIAIAAPKNTAAMIYARSGLATKNGISLANGVGVVDSDYRGEVIVALVNNGAEDFEITDGMRIAQLVITPVLTPDIEVCDSLDDTERGGGGFGSTGIN
ncbi:MAG: dUTP diphosphatase [Ruminococcus sp.]|nr:dUTP diphosphatase [Ruminococcus sp.]